MGEGEMGDDDGVADVVVDDADDVDVVVADIVVDVATGPTISHSNSNRSGLHSIPACAT